MISAFVFTTVKHSNYAYQLRVPTAASAESTNIARSFTALRVQSGRSSVLRS